MIFKKAVAQGRGLMSPVAYIGLGQPGSEFIQADPKEMFIYTVGVPAITPKS